MIARLMGCAMLQSRASVEHVCKETNEDFFSLFTFCKFSALNRKFGITSNTFTFSPWWTLFALLKYLEFLRREGGPGQKKKDFSASLDIL